MLIEWRHRKGIKFKGNIKDHFSRIRDIDDIDEFLDPQSNVVHNPLLLKNIRQAVDRVSDGVKHGEKIIVFADPDPDGIIATVILVDYLNHLTDKAEYRYRERDTGHGVNVEDIDKDTDLLIIVDSSSSEFENVNELAKDMDVIILDHHNVEESDTELNAILVNPNQKDCDYPNKDLSGSGVTWKFIELMDYKYQKVNINNYLDMVGTSLLSDQMSMTNLENRFLVKKGLSKINNVGLLALVNATRNSDKKLNSQIWNFDIIPTVNTCTRNNEMYKAFKLLFEKDYFKSKRMADVLVSDNKTRKDRIKELFNQYLDIAEVEKFVFAVDENAKKNYNGLVSQKLSSHFRRPSLVLKDNGDTYQGSGRSYNGFDLQGFLKGCPYVNYAAGHSEAMGVGIDKDNWDKFKQYVDENIDETLFDPVIEYDIELDESDLDWDLVDEVLEIDEIWGSGSPPITVRLNNIFVEDREVFPPKKKEHVKIKADNIDLLKFNDGEYASEIESWDDISAIGGVSVNEFRGDKRIQLFMEDYVK